MPIRRQETHRVPIGGDELAVVVVTPEEGVADRMVLMLHGGPDGQKEGPGGLYRELADRLAAENVASARFDFRGCGESTGSYRDMTIDRQVRELRRVRQFVAERWRPTRWAMVGESFGATVGLRALDDSYHAIVLLWPAIWLLDGVFGSYVTPGRLHSARLNGYIDLGGKRIGIDFLTELVEVRDVSSALDGLRVPVLFVHGEADREVPFAQSARAAGLVAGDRRVVGLPGAGHRVPAARERETVYAETVAWIRDHL